MKVAVLILTVLAASASAGLFDGIWSVGLANTYLGKFQSAVNSEISTALSIFVQSITITITLIVQVSQSLIVMVTNFGLIAASLVVTVTADAAVFAAYVAVQLTANSVAVLITGPYTDLVTSVSAVVNLEISGLALLVSQGKVKYSCLQKAQVYIDGNITEFTVEVRQKRDEHSKKIKDQNDALVQQINDDYASYQKNISDTCSGQGSREAGCDVSQYLILRPEINKKNEGYVKKVKDNGDENRKDAEDKAAQLRISFDARYTKIKADIKKCSASP